MRRQLISVTLPICTAMLAAGTWPAHAGDLNPPPGPVGPTGRFGPRIEISDTNTPGDANSLFKITQPSSYYLTGNIIGESGKNGIRITVDNVTLDLNGFALIGVPGSLSGIEGSFVKGITTMNGTVSGWDNDGLELVNTVVTSVMSRILSTHNGRHGFNVGSGNRVVECIASFNGSSGFNSSSGNAFTGCTANNNPAGFITNDNSLVIDCIAAGNQGIGITVADGCIVNRCTASENTGPGIRVQGTGGNDAGALVTRCNAVNNTAAGIQVSAGNGHRIEDNNVSGNLIGIDVNSIGNLIIRNSASSNTTSNYDIVVGNSFGPIVNVGGVGDISGTANANHPWANFEL